MEMNRLNRKVLKNQFNNVIYLHVHVKFIHSVYKMQFLAIVLYKEHILHVSFDCFVRVLDCSIILIHFYLMC